MERLERGKQGLIVGMAIVFAVSAAVKFKAELGDTAAAIREWANSTFTSGDAPAWGDVTGKPFSTIGSGATVVRDALTIEAPFWREVEEKPFSTIGEGLAVDGEVLVAKAQTPLWSAVTSKPFSIIGDGLLVENDVVVPGGYLWSSGDYDTVQVNQDMIYEISFAGTYGKWFAEFDIIPHYTNFRNNRYRFYERYRISGHSSGADWCNIEEVTYLGGSPYFEGLRLIGVREQAYGNLYLRFYSRQSNDMQGCEIAVRSYGGMTLRKGKPVMVASYNDSPTAPLNDIAYMKKAPGVEGKFTMFGLQNMIGHKYQLLGWQILSRSQYTKFPRYLELDLVHGAWDVESRRPNSYKYIHGFGVNKSNLLSTLVLDSLAGFKIDSIVALQNGDTMFFYAEYVPPTNKPAMYTMVDNFKEVGWPNGGTYLGNPFEVNTNFYEEPITTNERPWRYDACTWVSTSVPQYSGEASTWAEVKEKPFTSIGSGLSVIQKSDTDFELYVTNDVYPSWDNVSGKPFNRFSNKFYVYENGTVDIDTRNFVTQSQLNAAIATVSDSDAKLDDDNEFTKKNTFAVNTNADFTVRQNEGAYFNVRPNNIDMLMGANNASIGLHNTDLKLAFGKPDNQATITFGQVPGGYNGVKFQSRGASYFDTEVVVDDEHTLSWGTDPDNYPWHYHDNEYITKGWADGAYGGQSSGTPEWNNVQHKPFSTIGTGLTVSNNVLSATATAPAWGEVTSKPFTSIGTGLMVTGDVLSATAATPTWATTTGKPFSSIGQGLIVTADELSTLTTWSEVTSKPFSSIGSGLSVVNNTLTAPTPTWATTTGKPFNTLDLANSFIVIDGELGTRQTVPFWSSVFNKPFESIGAGLSVNGGVLSADASGDFMKLAGGNTFTGAQTGTLANYEAFKLTGSGTNQMYF
ncbi:MAG: hypothetical protein LBT73_00120, partial [Tannerellaceae bacterium]|nr:hypothetical protein [Tannerellaceae bacterium]